METERLKQINEMMETRYTRIKMALYILVEENIMSELEAEVIRESIYGEEMRKRFIKGINNEKDPKKTKTYKKHK